MRVAESVKVNNALYEEHIYKLNNGYVVTFVEFAEMEDGVIVEEVHVETPKGKKVKPDTWLYKSAVRTVEIFANPTRSKL